MKMTVVPNTFHLFFCLAVMLVMGPGRLLLPPTGACAAAATVATAVVEDDGTTTTTTCTSTTSSNDDDDKDNKKEEENDADDDFELQDDRDKPGIQVINAILANMWPAMSNSLLANMRANPLLVDPYILKVKSGKFRYTPTIRSIQLVSEPTTTEPTSAEPTTSDQEQNKTTTSAAAAAAPNAAAPPPPRFQCGMVYQGRPGLDLVLTGADMYNKTATEKVVVGVFKRVLRRLVPDVFVEINSVDLAAHIEVELDMSGNGPMQNSLEFFFLSRPHVQWDLEFSLTKAHIPLMGEDSLDSILTRALEGIDRDHPVRVKF